MFAIAYVVREDPIYSWDFRGYWIMYANFWVGISDFLPWLAGVIKAIRQSDYNPAPIIPLLPFQVLFGGARAGYIGAIASLYLVPVALLTAYFTIAQAKRFEVAVSREGVWLLAALALLFPPFWMPSLRGYPDIVGCLPLVALSVLFFTQDVNQKLPWKYLVVAGILLWLPFLMRRWYAFALIALVVAAATTGLVQHMRRRNCEKNGSPLFPLALFRNLLAVGGISVLCVAVVQWGLVVQALYTDYSDIYSAYQIDLGTHVSSVYRHFGPVVLILAAFGMLGGLITSQLRLPTLFVVVNVVVLIGLFTRIQEFGEHHFLPLAVWIFSLSAIGLVLAIGRVTSQFGRRLAVFASVMFFLLSFVNSFVLPVQFLSQIFPESRRYPLKSSNMEQYAMLVGDMRRVLEKKDRVAFFASGSSLNSDVIDSVAGGTLSLFVQPVSHIDKRDRFNLDALSASYAVASVPAQTHVAASDQRVITVPAAEIFSGSGIGAAYVALPEVYHMKGFDARLFRKKRAFTFSEMSRFVDALIAFYPDWRSHYRVGSLVRATGFVELGEVGGGVFREGDDRVLLHPGDKTATKATYGFGRWNGEALYQIGLSVPETYKVQCPDADGVRVNVSIRGEEVFSGIIAPNGTRTDVAIPHPETDGTFSLVVDKLGTLSCDWLHVSLVTGPL